jgi:hypothetical protein
VRADLDTLLVAGGMGTQAGHARRGPPGGAPPPRAARAANRLGVLGGVSSSPRPGSSTAGRATTHWEWCDALAVRFPRVQVDRDPIFVRDGNVYTSAGVTAGMDLALALVEEDHGRALALEVAAADGAVPPPPGRPVAVQRPLAAQAADREPLRDLQPGRGGSRPRLLGARSSPAASR